MEKEEGYIPDRGQERLFQIYLKEKEQPKLVLTLAAPGTGKTTTVVQLFKAIHSNRHKSNIKRMLFLTFTRRTRNDILKKFQKDGFLQKHPFLHRIVRSFHSLAYSTLFWDSIITETDINRKIKEIAVEAKLDVDEADKGKVNRLIKQINEAISKGQVKQKIDFYLERNATFANIFQKYIDWLQQCFEESLSISYDYSLIKLEQRIKNNKYPHMIDLDSIDLLIVDEFQDSNPAQMKIIRAILQKNPQMRLLLLGDIDQTIYTWRGADLVYLQELIEQYQQKNEYQNVYLENTHRLGSEVVEISQKLIEHRPRYQQFRQRHYRGQVPIPKNIENNHATEVRQFQSQFSEVSWVFNKIKQLTKSGLRYKDMTVLLRSFKLTSFFKKFQFLNEKNARQTGQSLIPITLKTDEVNSTIKNILAWMVYFYKKQFYPNESAKQEIKIILESMSPKASTLNKMIEGNKIEKQYVVTRNLSFNQQQNWNLFFINFAQISNKIAEIIPKQSFSDVFKSLYELLEKKQIIEEANSIDIEQFLDFTKIIQSSLDRHQRNNYPAYSIIEQLIIRRYYMIDRERKKGKNKNKKQIQGEKQSVQLDLHGKPVPKEEKKNEFYKLVLRKVGKQKRQTMLSQQQQSQSIRKKQEYQSEKDKKEIQFTNQQDSVQFQTTFRCKGLQYKAVFMVAMNYDIFQQPFDSIPRVRKDYVSDANRQRQLSKQLTRKMLREEEELRVVYTALTRTSKYSYVSASKNDNRSFNQGIKHPHFEFLQREAKISEHMPFDKDEDKQFKSQFQTFFPSKEAEIAVRPKKQQSSNHRLDQWLTPKKQ